MASAFDYIFNIGGNFSAQITSMSAATGQFTAQAEVAESKTRALTSALAGFSYAKDVAQNVAEGVSALSTAGVALDKQMHDLSAVAGVTGEGLKQIERFARESAKTFGTDASVAVEGYKLLLSQLSPELGKYPDALSAMGDCIQTTSKLMGGDGVAAAQVLTTAMNQYGVSMEDPTAAAGEMARMMNVMAAAGQAGSAELPAISAALQQCGMAAKAANVSFEETNAAIQVLDKAGKKASEGGVALRNVLGQLSKGRFVEKQAAEELQKAGIDVVALGDNSKSLKERLEMLKPMLNDSALLSKFFGVENANAARALIQGTGALQDFTDAVTGTNSAEAQAAIIMDSYAERQARINQKIEDFKISLFQATGDTALWATTITQLLVPLAQIWPLLEGIWKGLAAIKLLNVKKIFRDISNGANSCVRSLRNCMIGTYMLGVSFVGFKVMAVNACRAVSTAIMSIPVVGWIAAAIAAVIAVIQLLWDKCKGFRVAVFTALELFKRIGELIVKALQIAWQWLVDLWQRTSEWITKAVAWITQAYNAVVNFFVGIWQRVVEFVAGVVSWIVEAFNKVVSFFVNVWQNIIEGISWVRERISAFIELVGGVFSAVYNTVVGYLAQIWAKISSVVDRVRTKLANFLRPIVAACQQAYNAIKGWFNSLFSWIENKINSVVDWFVNLYNKIAAALGWEEIKARGRARAEESWTKDHPATNGQRRTTAGSGAAPVVPAAGTTDVTGGTLGNAGHGSLSGGSSFGSSSSSSGDNGKIKNITINIEKLIETFTIHTATMGESMDQMRAAVLEALMGAVNDTQLANS